jgi:cellulose synthase (UDP-forming)
LEAYASQQYRWARGSLDVMFRYNPLFRRGLTFAQKMQYLYYAGYYLNGIVVLIDALIPLIFLYFNVVPVNDYTGNFVIYFAPFILLTLYFLMRSTAHTVTFRAIQLTLATSFVYLMASIASIIGKRTPFKVTSKVARAQGNFLVTALPNIIYIILGIGGVVFALHRDGITPAIITNTSWVLFNIVFFWPFIQMAYPWRSTIARLFHSATPSPLRLDSLSKISPPDTKENSQLV